MSAEANGAAGPLESLLAQIDTAMEVLSEERRALMQGAFDRIAQLSERKSEILELLEAAIRSAPRTHAVVVALTRLIADSRRNEAIIAAARDGFAQARRRIAAIARAQRGVVAYQEDGSLISCRSDAANTDRSA